MTISYMLQKEGFVVITHMYSASAVVLSSCSEINYCHGKMVVLAVPENKNAIKTALTSSSFQLFEPGTTHMCCADAGVLPSCFDASNGTSMMLPLPEIGS